MSKAEIRIIILTGSELRHVFFRKYMALQPGIRVLRTYCEGLEKSLTTLIQQKEEITDYRQRHLQARDCAEYDYFNLFVENIDDRSNPVHIPKGSINDTGHVEALLAHDPDLVVSYGCSIIRGKLLEEYAGRFVNVHLGLSPWYRGSGTNFWPLVNGEPEYVGATFMHIDAGVDTGEIIHQIRAEYCWGDTPHTIGNRLIRDMTRVYADIIRNFGKLQRMVQPSEPEQVKYYRKKDFTEESVRQLYKNFCNGMIERYLAEKEKRNACVPLVKNPVIVGAGNS